MVKPEIPNPEPTFKLPLTPRYLQQGFTSFVCRLISVCIQGILQAFLFSTISFAFDVCEHEKKYSQIWYVNNCDGKKLEIKKENTEISFDINFEIENRFLNIIIIKNRSYNIITIINKNTWF